MTTKAKIYIENNIALLDRSIEQFIDEAPKDLQPELRNILYHSDIYKLDMLRNAELETDKFIAICAIPYGVSLLHSPEDYPCTMIVWYHPEEGYCITSPDYPSLLNKDFSTEYIIGWDEKTFEQCLNEFEAHLELDHELRHFSYLESPTEKVKKALQKIKI